MCCECLLCHIYWKLLISCCLACAVFRPWQYKVRLIWGSSLAQWLFCVFKMSDIARWERIPSWWQWNFVPWLWSNVEQDCFLCSNFSPTVNVSVVAISMNFCSMLYQMQFCYSVWYTICTQLAAQHFIWCLSWPWRKTASTLSEIVSNRVWGIWLCGGEGANKLIKQVSYTYYALFLIGYLSHLNLFHSPQIYTN